MNRILFLLCALLLPPALAFAQPKGYKVLADDQAFRKNYAKAAENTLSIKSSFRQEKNLSMLAEKINSTGLFYFKKSNKVRMEYTQPYKYLLIINNDRILIQDQQKKKVYSAGDNKLFKVINQVIIDCVQGKALENKSFQTKVFESDKGYCLDLVPQAKEMKRLFATIRVFVGKDDFSINQIELREAMGDNTIITFLNKQLNTSIRDEVFDVK
jgi:outer membrane lipoprotein-sorting protein